ncbi:hypothetical protein ACSBR1_024474 [Camellia fascicularis]
MRNSRGRLLDDLVSSFLASSALQAEAHAIRLARSLAQAHNASMVEIETDNQSLIKLCLSEDVPPWECMAMVHDIRSLSKPRQWNFGWTRRANRAAHWVANSYATKKTSC